MWDILHVHSTCIMCIQYKNVVYRKYTHLRFCVMKICITCNKMQITYIMLSELHCTVCTESMVKYGKKLFGIFLVKYQVNCLENIW